jgi:hypothetical protein
MLMVRQGGSCLVAMSPEHTALKQGMNVTTHSIEAGNQLITRSKIE